MEIGILTFHDSINPGAYLQAFALMNIVKNFGYEVEIINYKNKTHWFREYGGLLISKHPIAVFLNIKKILKYKKCHKRFNLNPKNLVLNSTKLKTDKYDVIIVGSDIVWDYKRPHLGSDPIYFGKGLYPKKLVSYGASFGSVNKDDNPPNFVIDGFKKFSSISARDENSKDIVKKLAGIDAEIVLDPTFLFDFSEYEVLPKEKDYLLVYDTYLSNSAIDKLKDFSRQKKIQTIAINFKQKWCDKNIILVDPFEWLGFFKNAAYVVTSRTHGTIFSIKYNTNFAVVDNWEYMIKQSHSYLN